MMWAALITTTIVIVVRFVWVFPATYLKRPTPPWQETFLIGFTGIRGVVSLVAALSVPEMIGDQPFPERDLILFVTFCVILVSLIGQGTTLPGSHSDSEARCGGVHVKRPRPSGTRWRPASPAFRPP